MASVASHILSGSWKLRLEFFLPPTLRSIRLAPAKLSHLPERASACPGTWKSSLADSRRAESCALLRSRVVPAPTNFDLLYPRGRPPSVPFLCKCGWEDVPLATRFSC